MNIKDVKRIYFIGIGGIGISALAKMFLHMGVKVSGINDSESPETLNELRERGVQIDQPPNGQRAPLTIREADVYVYSVAWEGRAPEILEAARATGKPVLTYFEALGEVARNYKVLAISGTHGKTTTTAMTAQALIAAGLDPTVIVGSLVDWGDGVRTNFRAGRGEYLLVEACEYKRHFLHFDPWILAITNIEFDHPDYYQDLNDVKDAFDELARKSNIVLSRESINKFLSEVPELKVPGTHNKENAALAIAVSDALGADLRKAKEALANFAGTWRRFEYLGETQEGAAVYSDYAHHPTEIKATIATARKARGGGKLIAVFEPHMFSRTEKLFDDFAKSFTDADEVIIAPIYAAREKPIDGISAKTLAQKVGEYNQNTRYANTLKSAGKLARELAGYGDTIVFMGAGDIYKVAQTLIF